MEILVVPVTSCNDDLATDYLCSPICKAFDFCIVDNATPSCPNLQ